MGKTVGLVFPKKKAPEFVCVVCGETFKSQKALDKHVEEKHPATPPENGEPPKQ